MIVKNKQDGIDKKKRQKEEEKLLDLALKWNYIDGVLPILKSRENDMKKTDQNFREVRF